MKNWRVYLMSAALSAIVLFLVVRPFHAAGVTVVSGVINDAQGNPANGRLVMQLAVPAVYQAQNIVVSTAPIYFSLVNGAVTGGSPIYDNDGMQPAKDYYQWFAYDTRGALITGGDVYVPAGGTFNLSAAIPTSILTTNISYANPVLANQSNNFTAVQQFSAGIQTDSITGTLSSGTFQITGAAGVSGQPGEGIQWTGGAGNAGGGGGAITMTGGAAPAGGTAGNVTIGAGASVSGLGGSANITAGNGNQGGSTGLVAGNANGGSGGNGGVILLQPGAKDGGGNMGNVQIMRGVWENGTGYKHARQSACTTGGTAGNTCDTTFNWPGSAFADTNYTVVCVVDTPTNFPYVLYTKTKATGTVVVTIATLTNAAATGTLNCTGVHD